MKEKKTKKKKKSDLITRPELQPLLALMIHLKKGVKK